MRGSRQTLTHRYLSSAVTLALLLLAAGRATAVDPNWSPTGSMAFARRDHTATLLASGKVLIVGPPFAASELFDPVAGNFTATGRALFPHAGGLSATRLVDGRVLVVGGGGGGVGTAFAEIYDPVSGTFSSAGSTIFPHAYHNAVRLSNGKVLIAGGQGAIGAAELYDPVSGTFAVTGSLQGDRFGAGHALLPDGRVLIVGGARLTSPGNSACLGSAEVYTPSTGSFGFVGAPTFFPCVLGGELPVLNSGKVLVVGGSSSRAANLFDPTTNAFVHTGGLTTLHGSSTITLLSDGRVLVAGGYIAVGPVTTATVEIYDPTSGTFASTANMNSPRQQHTATRLWDGRVLVTGGYNGSVNVKSAEIFGPALIQVLIEIKPGSAVAPINSRSQGLIPVAIVSTESFDAPTRVDGNSLRFGRTGNEQSLAFCNASPEDVNGDDLVDLVCHFVNTLTGFVAGDTSGVLKGVTVDGIPIVGTDAIRVVR